MALPISILGANFTVQYQRLSAQQRRERKKRTAMMLAKKASMKTGKSISLGEVELTEIKKGGENASVGLDPEGINLKTGNRMADAIMVEQAKDKEAMDAIYKSPSNKSSGSDNTPETPRSHYDGLSITDLDSFYSDKSPSPMRTPRVAIGASGTENNLKLKNSLTNVMGLLKEMKSHEEKDDLDPSDKRHHLVAVMEQVKQVSTQLLQESQEDIRRAQERATLMQLGVSALEKTAQAMLDSVPDPDDV